MPAFHKKFLDALAITAAVAATAAAPIAVGLRGVYYVIAQAKFVYGSGGTSAKAYLQTSLDGGTTWTDIMCFAFTTASATKISAVVVTTALAAAGAPTDGTLADNTILSGLIGSMFRVKYVTTGTYGGTTTLSVDVQFLSVGA